MKRTPCFQPSPAGFCGMTDPIGTTINCGATPAVNRKISDLDVLHVENGLEVLGDIDHFVGVAAIGLLLAIGSARCDRRGCRI
jgi:hypothetical protein